ncbi:MAG: lytic transglycosylase domain-containing protein [Desulfobacteraceae bacterium]|nr:lytic transglycosylase domain-containing protein [Desulfobacteraceae bacterium]
MNRDRIKYIGITIFYTLILLISADLTAHGDIYRYIDENGVMHFTNTPTSSNQKFKLFLREKPKTSLRYSTKKYDDIIANASQQYGVAFPLLKAIIKAESGFDPRAVSKKGAKGLMQIMPQNFKLLGIEDPFDPSQNIHAGARYFKQMYDRFGKLALSLAAYNAGPDAVARYKTVPPYEETEEYVKRVLKFYYSYKNL